MGTIAQRKLKDGTIRYRAEIRINKKGFPAFKESQTFSTKRSANLWIGKREAEIDENPEILVCEIGDNFAQIQRNPHRLL